MLHLTCTVYRNSVYRKTDQLDALGVYLVLGVQEGAFKEAFKFIFASISTKQKLNTSGSGENIERVYLL